MARENQGLQIAPDHLRHAYHRTGRDIVFVLPAVRRGRRQGEGQPRQDNRGDQGCRQERRGCQHAQEVDRRGDNGQGRYDHHDHLQRRHEEVRRQLSRGSPLLSSAGGEDAAEHQRRERKAGPGRRQGEEARGRLRGARGEQAAADRRLQEGRRGGQQGPGRRASQVPEPIGIASPKRRPSSRAIWRPPARKRPPRWPRSSRRSRTHWPIQEAPASTNARLATEWKR